MADLVALAQRVHKIESHFGNNPMAWGQGSTYDVLRRMLTGAINNCDVPNITRLVVLLETARVTPGLWINYRPPT